MDDYGPSFARAYRRLYGSYGRTFGSRLMARVTRRGRALDLACGTGELAGFLVGEGFEVVGVDRSPEMLALAREEAPGATFVPGDITRLEVPGRFALVTSVSHSFNHLEDLHPVLRGAARVAEPGALLAFDLLTARGLERWNGISVDDEEDCLIVQRGVCDGDRGLRRLTGFLRGPEGWERFATVLRYRVFPLAEVRRALESCGWQDVEFTGRADLVQPVEDPERLRDVVVLARRGREG